MSNFITTSQRLFLAQNWALRRTTGGHFSWFVKATLSKLENYGDGSWFVLLHLSQVYCIEAGSNWTCCRRYFQIWILINSSSKCVLGGLVDNDLASVHEMARPRTGDIPLPESIIKEFIYAYIRHQDSACHVLRLHEKRRYSTQVQIIEVSFFSNSWNGQWCTLNFCMPCMAC